MRRSVSNQNLVKKNAPIGIKRIVSVPAMMSDFMRDVVQEIQIESIMRTPAVAAAACLPIDKFPDDILSSSEFSDEEITYVSCMECPADGDCTRLPDEENIVNRRVLVELMRNRRKEESDDREEK
jgi:hypothetical protein